MFIALDKLTAVRMYDLITHHWKLTVEQLEKEVAKGKYGDQELLEKSRELAMDKRNGNLCGCKFGAKRNTEVSKMGFRH
jgi:hypothetical protein